MDNNANSISPIGHGHGLVGAVTGSSPVQPQSELQRETGLVARRTDVLQGLVNSLVVRLEAVLRPSMPTPEGATVAKEDNSPQTQIGGFLRNHTQDMNILIYKLDDVLRRLEV